MDKKVDYNGNFLNSATSYSEELTRYFNTTFPTAEMLIEAAVKWPQLFRQRPETLIGNIEGVYDHFQDKGLSLEGYLKAAVKQPQLFYQRPETLIGNIEGVYEYFKIRDYL